MSSLCEDYPCCGHTSEDPCGPQEYDQPGYYDTSVKGQEHRLCDHENGDCDVDYDDEPDPDAPHNHTDDTYTGWDGVTRCDVCDVIVTLAPHEFV